MRSFRNPSPSVCLVAILAILLVGLCSVSAQSQPSATANPPVAKVVGTVKSVQASSITVTAPTGDITATLSAATKILRVLPGAKDLKSAAPIQPQDLQPGDAVRVRGQGSADGHTIAALEIIVIKQSDVAAKQQHEREDWQKRGVGGLVNKVDPSAATITISTGAGTAHSILVRVSKDTILRRYAAGSVNFDDAKPAPLDQIRAGDQLRARGTRSPDGSELAAEEIVSGSFRNIAGAITATDAANNTVTVQDLIAKGPVVVHISSDSQVKKLPLEMAQRVAARLKSAGAGDQPASSQNASSHPAPTNHSSAPPAESAANAQAHGAGGAPGGNGPPDFQRLVARLPASTIADLQKGDSVMLVATQGTDSASVTAITLLAGVEPLLTAAQSRSYSLLSPWSMSSSGGEGDSGP